MHDLFMDHFLESIWMGFQKKEKRKNSYEQVYVRNNSRHGLEEWCEGGGKYSNT